MGIVELYVTIISTLSLVFSLLVYFGMHPRRIKLLLTGFARFMRLYPQVIIVTFLILILVNILIIGFKVGYFSNILTGIIGGITGLLVGILSNFLLGLTIRRRVKSKNTHLLAVMASRFRNVVDMPRGAKIASATVGSHIAWLQTALDSYGISFNPVFIPTNELFLALKLGVVDAVLITKHPLDIMKACIESGEIRLLPWSGSAQEAVTRAFPTETRLTVLAANTYDGQQGDIQGYASY
jgi:hypothetical protein